MEATAHLLGVAGTGAVASLELTISEDLAVEEGQVVRAGPIEALIRVRVR